MQCQVIALYIYKKHAQSRAKKGSSTCTGVSVLPVVMATSRCFMQSRQSSCCMTTPTQHSGSHHVRRHMTDDFINHCAVVKVHYGRKDRDLWRWRYQTWVLFLDERIIIKQCMLRHLRKERKQIQRSRENQQNRRVVKCTCSAEFCSRVLECNGCILTGAACSKW